MTRSQCYWTGPRRCCRSILRNSPRWNWSSRYSSPGRSSNRYSSTDRRTALLPKPELTRPVGRRTRFGSRPWQDYFAVPTSGLPIRFHQFLDRGEELPQNLAAKFAGLAKSAVKTPCPGRDDTKGTASLAEFRRRHPDVGALPEPAAAGPSGANGPAGFPNRASSLRVPRPAMRPELREIRQLRIVVGVLGLDEPDWV